MKSHTIARAILVILLSPDLKATILLTWCLHFVGLQEDTCSISEASFSVPKFIDCSLRRTSLFSLLERKKNEYNFTFMQEQHLCISPGIISIVYSIETFFIPIWFSEFPIISFFLGLSYIETCGLHQMSFETSFMHPIGTLSFLFSVSQWVPWNHVPP